jgi:putative ABC transport system ATP-binding protein
MTHALRSIDLSVQEGVPVDYRPFRLRQVHTAEPISVCSRAFSGGHYAIGGVDVGGMRDAALSALRNEKIGFVFQAFNLIPDLTIQANVEVPALPWHGGSRMQAACGLGTGPGRTGQPHVALSGELSGGQQQRVAIARAIAGTPALLLATRPETWTRRCRGGHGDSA